jgi:NAD(P)-dependent dehydrogenase (short-subunit alcohol dehydrogenase family)
MKLSGRVAIITGGTTGIGKATALLFMREGAKVVIAGRDAEKGKAALDELLKESTEAIYIKADVSKSLDVKRLVDRTVETYGKINILFNNAAINPVGSATETSEELWNKVIAINLTGVFLCSKYVIPYMLESGGGSIVNTGSINSFMATKNEVAYHSSKGGVLMLTRATALDYANRNIRVNCICPGAIDTPLLETILNEFPNPEEIRAEMIKRHPVNRVGLPEEVANLALFLASDDSSFVTGTAIPVDGGMLAGWT